MLNKFPFIFIVVCFILFSSCSKKKDYDIDVICEMNNTGDYMIKWEIFPAIINGNVKIYRSDNPDKFADKEVELELPVQNGIAIMKKGDYARSYFKLVFGRNLYAITSDRVIKAENVLNFREMGGYHNRSGQQVKWGKLYRSGLLSNASRSDITLLKSLHIKTAVDLRTDEEIASASPAFFMDQIYRIPLLCIEAQSYIGKVIKGQMKKGDTLLFQQDWHAALVKNNTENFKRYFEILADSSNYPIIVYCTLGKKRVGVIMFLTLAALGVDREQIYGDYMLSNSYMNFSAIVNKADTLSPEIQEALTVLLAPQREAIEYTCKYIEKEYGSLNNYFEKELQLTAKKREKLKELLLYPKNY